MKKTSRFLAVLLAFALVLGCCQIAAADYSGDLENVDLVYWTISNPDQKDEALVMEQLNAIALDALNVNLDLEIVATGEIKEKFNKAMAAQERIDLVWTGYVQPIQELVNLGALQPLDDLMAEYGPDLIASLDERLLDAHRSADGLLYQFPAWQGMVGNRSYYAFPKNKIDATVGEQWIKDFEAAMYANWDKNTVEAHAAVWNMVGDLLAALKEADMLGLGYNPVTNSLEDWYDPRTRNSVGTYGYIDWYDDTFTVKAMVDEPWALECAKLKADWFEKGYIRADIAALDKADVNSREGYEDPVSEDCYVMTGHNGFTDDLSKELTGIAREVYTVHTNPFCMTTLGNATGTSIPFTAAEPERAMMFMNWLVSKDEKAIEWYNLFGYGIEGTHYEWNEDHTEIKVFGGEGQAAGDWDYGQRPWCMGTLLNAYSAPVYPTAYYEELMALQVDAYTSPLLGFSFDYSDVETEYNLLASVNTEYSDMIRRGYVGTADIEAKYEEYKDKMYSCGLEDVIAAIQEQVTAFVTENERVW